MMEAFFAEWAGWIITTAAAGAVTLSVSWHFWMRELIVKHRSPDDHGFGTGITNDLAKRQLNVMQDWAATNEKQMDSLNRSIRDNTHYMKVVATNLTGEEPLPPVD